nr:U-box domain-containing protein 1-like [Tanacetum cinerariifolium]
KNSIPTSRVMWEVKPRERHGHMIIEIVYPLLEANEVILFLKLTIDVCGSKQEEALKWESHDKVVADIDDHHIVIEASRYQIMSFKRNEMEVFQLCVKSFEIHRELKNKVFVHQPEGFIKIGEVDSLQTEKRHYMALKRRQWHGTLLSKERLVKKLTILCIRNLLGIGSGELISYRSGSTLQLLCVPVETSFFKRSKSKDIIDIEKLKEIIVTIMVFNKGVPKGQNHHYPSMIINIPNECRCPISLDLIRDGVIVPSDHMYDTSPKSGQRTDLSIST